MDDRRYSGLTKLGLGVLACSSALAVCRSWGDSAGSVAFVLVADAALVLLFACRRCRAGGAAAGSGGRIKAAVWTLTALLMGMFTYALRVAPMMPLAIGAIIFFLCFCEAEPERTQIGIGLAAGQYGELVKMSVGVVACNSALANHHARGGEGSLSLSLAFVFILYAAFLTLVWLFLRRFNGRAGGAGQQ